MKTTPLVRALAWRTQMTTTCSAMVMTASVVASGDAGERYACCCTLPCALDCTLLCTPYNQCCQLRPASSRAVVSFEMQAQPTAVMLL